MTRFDIPEGYTPYCTRDVIRRKSSQKMSNKLLDEGIYVIGFFYPVVPKRKV